MHFINQTVSTCIFLCQVTRSSVEQYTGYGYPPYCEMILMRADDDGSTPPDLTLPVTLTGVEQPTTITLKRDAERLEKLSKQKSGKL